MSKQAFSKARTNFDPNIVKESFLITARTMSSVDDLTLYRDKYRLCAIDGSDVVLDNLGVNNVKGVLSIMRDTILNTNILPEPLFRLINTDKMRVREANGELRITPVPQMNPYGAPGKSPYTGQALTQADGKIQRLNALRGSGADLKMTVDSFLDMTHDKLELDNGL